MGYSREVYAKVSSIYEERRKNASADLEARIERANREIPEMKELDARMASTGLRIMEAMRKNDGGKALAEVQAENERMNAERKKLLWAHGFPEDFCEARWICPHCGDTGFVSGKRCACLSKALYEAQAASSGLGALIGKQTFENFDTSFYENEDDMQSIKKYCRVFAITGVKNGENLLLMGGTGMGKTHLSTAIADEVMKNGGSVIYESAPHVLDDFRYEQFGRGWNDRTPVRTDKYFEADLLILDDLGSELPGTFGVSVLYNLLNTRLNEHRSMLFNTNYSQKEMISAYDRRIVSRILSSFDVFTLKGEDIRMQKMRG